MEGRGESVVRLVCGEDEEWVGFLLCGVGDECPEKPVFVHRVECLIIVISLVQVTRSSSSEEEKSSNDDEERRRKQVEASKPSRTKEQKHVQHHHLQHHRNHRLSSRHPHEISLPFTASSFPLIIALLLPNLHFHLHLLQYPLACSECFLPMGR